MHPRPRVRARLPPLRLAHPLCLAHPSRLAHRLPLFLERPLCLVLLRPLPLRLV